MTMCDNKGKGKKRIKNLSYKLDFSEILFKMKCKSSKATRMVD